MKNAKMLTIALAAVLALSLVGCVFLLAIAALFSPHASASHLAPAFTTDATGKSSLGGILAVVAVAPWFNGP